MPRKNRRPESGTWSRLGWLACLPLAIGCAWILGRAALAALYLSLAHEQLDHSQEGPLSQQAATLARNLAPWMQEAHSSFARNRAADGDATGAIAAFGDALRWAPGDSQIWRDMVRSLTRAARFDQTTLLALQQTSRLAPRSPGIQLGTALDGVYFWRHGNDDLRRLWLQSMRYTLAHDRSTFLFQVARSQRESVFCAYTGDQLPVSDWCQRAEWMRRVCAIPTLPQQKRRACRKYGFNPQPVVPPAAQPLLPPQSSPPPSP